MRRLAIGVGAAVCVALGAAAAAQREPVPLRARMLAAEDARGSREPGAGSRTSDPLAPLYEGLTSLPEIQVIAVRGLGRQERPDLIPRIAPLLGAVQASVRAEAANALAQAVSRGDGAPAFAPLRERLSRERDPDVRGVLARSLGRLTYRTANEAIAAQAAVLSALDPATATPPGVTVLGVASGLESLARRSSGVATLGDPARARLVELARFGLAADGAESADPAAAMARRVRRLAVSALTTASALTDAIVVAAAADPDAQVRRLAVVGAGRLRAEARAAEVLERALFDADPRVRIEALRQRTESPGRVACQAARMAMADDNPHVELAAIDLAGRVCQTDVEAVQTLDALATPPDVADPDRPMWHRSAHALVALARLMPDRTRLRLAPFAAHPVWQVRQYAAQAAGLAGAAATLDTLARDPDHNVCDAALTELARRVDRRGDPAFIAALARPDGQVVRTAARALTGTPRRAEASRALVTALARVSVDLRETSRDVRIALLDRLEETGAGLAWVRDELAPYASDFDPVVAVRAATLLTKWRGAEVRATPQPLPRSPLPAIERLAILDDTVAVVTMARGGVWRMRLFAGEAPTNVARFARMAATGAFNRRTFHRVEPTFVIQGGSPGANEYAGEGPFTRDEVGLRSHLRGTIGISTRGRDTGDGQIFVNLVDNVRLDHHYTIIGEVIDGLDVVDEILEGDAIARIVLERRR